MMFWPSDISVRLGRMLEEGGTVKETGRRDKPEGASRHRHQGLAAPNDGGPRAVPGSQQLATPHAASRGPPAVRWRCQDVPQARRLSANCANLRQLLFP